MNIFEQEFLMAQVAEYSGLDKGKFQLWTNRYSITGGGEEPQGGGKRGVARIFKFNHIMEYAIAKEFVEAGLSPKTAFKHGAKFAYFGTVGELGEAPRLPALPAHDSHGQTLIGVGGDECWIGCWKENDTSVLGEIFSHLGGQNGSASHCTIINASIVFRQVCKRMGLHDFEVLNELYQVN
ncbi:MAG: hypothetical protein EpisKO_04220 [Epibacterium sp.]